MKNQSGQGLVTFVAFLVVAFICYCSFSSSYKDDCEQAIDEYNQWVTQSNITVRANQALVQQNSFLQGITFKEFQSIPLSILDTESALTIYSKLEEYENNNNSILEYNNRQVDLCNQIIMQYNLVVTLFTF